MKYNPDPIRTRKEIELEVGNTAKSFAVGFNLDVEDILLRAENHRDETINILLDKHDCDTMIKALQEARAAKWGIEK
jgi:hypothetical protein